MIGRRAAPILRRCSSATSPDRKGERPRAHLANFTGVLQADAYAGFDRLYGERIKEAACWAHVRRKFYDIHVTRSPRRSPLEALERIGRLYKIEEEIRGRPPSERHAVRQARAGPELKSLYEWLHKTVDHAVEEERTRQGDPLCALELDRAHALLRGWTTRDR